MNRNQGYIQPRSSNKQGGQTNIPHHYPAFNQVAEKSYYSIVQHRADVGAFTGGGGGPGRVSQYPASVAGGPPTNSAQVSQSSQLRAHQPASHAVATSVPHSVIHSHHPVLSSGGATGAITSAVQQQVVPPGSSQVGTHELNTQAIQQGSTQQMQQVHGVALQTATHTIMYSSTNQNAQQQGSQQANPVRRIMNGQTPYYPHPAQQNAAVIHGGQRQVLTAASAQQMAAQAQAHNFSPFMVAHHPQLIHQTSTGIYQHPAYNAAIAAQQHRPGASSAQPQYGMPAPQQHQPTYIPQYSQMQPPIFYGGGQPTSAVKPAPAIAPTQRGSKAIAIIDPSTNKHIVLNDTPSATSKSSRPSSPTRSRDSSASRVPPPRSANQGKIQPSNIPAQFALQVIQVTQAAVEESEGKSENVDKPHDDEDSASALSTTNDSSNIRNNELDNDSRDINCRLSTSCVDSNIENSRIVPETNNLNKPTKYSATQAPSQSSRSNKQSKTVPVSETELAPPTPQAASRSKTAPSNTAPAFETEHVPTKPLKAAVKSFSPKELQQKDSHISIPLKEPSSETSPMPSNISMNSESLDADVDTNASISAHTVNVQHPKQEARISPPPMQKTIVIPTPQVVRTCPPPTYTQNNFLPAYARFNSPPPPIEHKQKEVSPVLAENSGKESKAPKDLTTIDQSVTDSRIVPEEKTTSTQPILAASPVSLKKTSTESSESTSKRGKEKTEDDNRQGPVSSAESPAKGDEHESPETSQSTVENATDESKPHENVKDHKEAFDVTKGPPLDYTNQGLYERPSPATVQDVTMEVAEMNLRNTSNYNEPSNLIGYSSPETKEQSTPEPQKSIPVETEVVDPNKKYTYDRQFLIDIGRRDISRKRPETLPNLEVVLDGPHRVHVLKPLKHMEDFTPIFMQNNRSRGGGGGGGSNMQYTQQRPMGPRNSQQGRRTQKVIDIKLTSSSDVKLKTTENAWKPASKKEKVEESGKDDDPEANSLDDLKKKMRGILNKLTPDNFDKLVLRVKTFPIENYDHLDAIISLIFDKAVDEQGFSATYSQLCQVLSIMTVKESSEKKEGSDKVKEARFRNLIINKCQKEFERDNAKDNTLLEMKQEIENAPPNKKKDLDAIYYFEESKLRKRSVGNIRFIGELYKLKMLTSPIMMRIILRLVNRIDEESLECLCKLLTTIGLTLENSATSSKAAMDELNGSFKNMNNIINEKKTSSRVRFLLMDVIDLRKNGWVPRREVTLPKTKAQVHEDIRKEDEIQQHQIMMNANNPRSRHNDDRSRERKKSRGGITEDGGWNTVGTVSNRRMPFDTNRLNKTFNRHGGGVGHDVMEFRTAFGNWARGSSGGAGATSNNQEETTSTNRFNVLENPMTGDLRRGRVFQQPQQQQQQQQPPRMGMGGFMNRPVVGQSYASKSMPPPSDKDNAISAVKKFVIPNERSKSNSRSNSRDSSRNRDVEVNKTPLTHDEAEEATKKIIDTLSSSTNYKESAKKVEETFSSHSLALFVQTSLDGNIDKNIDRRKLLGKFYQFLFTNKVLSIEKFIEGTKESLELIEDLMIDIPQIREYVGDIFGMILVNSAIQLEDLGLILANVVEKHRPSIFASVLRIAEKEMGANNVSEMLKRPSFNWNSFLSNCITKSDFITENNLSFLIVPAITPLDQKEIRKNLIHHFKNESPAEEIFQYIDTNKIEVGSTFVRTLTAALVESQMTVSEGGPLIVGEGFEAKLGKKLKVVHKYVDNNEHLELACLFAIQTLCVENEHPAGLIEQCFNVFYDKEVLSEESLREWENNTDPEEQLGKGVCLTSVRKFLQWLKDTEPEETDVSVSPLNDQVGEQPAALQ